MSYNLPGEINPFEAPRAGIGEEALSRDLHDSDAETIRRAHLGHEANIKSLGQLYYVGVFFGVIATLMVGLMAAGVIQPPPNPQQPTIDPATQRMVMGLLTVFYLFATALNYAMGYGLTHLQVWARWTSVVFAALGLAAALIYALVLGVLVSPVLSLFILLFGGGINGFILWLLISAKGGVVFSGEYKEIIRKTPHVKQKTSIIVKILLGLLITIILIGVIGMIVGSMMR